MRKKQKISDFKGLDKSVRLQRIIDTAVALFHRKGYRSTTLDDVSRELGITKAALYHYVSSKEKLLSVIYIQALDNIFRNVTPLLEQDLPPDEKLRHIIRNHIKEIIIQALPLFSVFFSEESQLPEEEFQEIREGKKKYTAIIETIIKEGISKRVFREVDPRLQAHAIIGMCNWIYKWYKPGHTRYTPDQVADHFISLLEAGYVEKGTEPGGAAVMSPAGGVLTKMKAHCDGLRDLIETLEEDSP